MENGTNIFFNSPCLPLGDRGKTNNNEKSTRYHQPVSGYSG